jgi:thioredoxin 1
MAPSPLRLIRFTASWCQPCKRLGPAADNLAKLHGVPVEVVDVDEHGDLAADFEILSVPTFVVLDGEDREVYRGSGAPAVSELADFLANVNNDPRLS